VVAKSAYTPLNPDHSRMCHGSAEYPSEGPSRADKASYVGIFSADLGSLHCAQTWGCGSVKKPCPSES